MDKIEKTVLKYGTIIYKLNGKLHKEDGPAVYYPDGSKKYYLNDKLHNEDGPALEYSNGYKEYRLNGELHREDGPAIVDPEKTEELYFLKNKRVSKKQWIRLRKQY
jgi:hypothetical protein